MTEQEIIKLHTELYEYLMGIHKVDASFRFRVRVNPRKDRNVANGYLFNGNNNYLETSFWDYKATPHTTPVIRLVYFFKTKKWSCELVGRDNKEREAYFEKMVEILGGFKKEKEATPIWSKELNNTLGYLETIGDFIKLERLRIDTLLKNSLKTDIVNIISLGDFEKDIEKVEKNKKPNIDAKTSTRISELVENHFLDIKKTNFPFALQNLYVENYQGITKLTIDEIPLNTQWVFLIGENGFGKTSILRAIAKLLVSEEVATVRPISRGSIIFGDTINNARIAKHQAVVNQQTNQFNISTYGVSRFALNALNQEESEKSKLKTYSLFYDNGQLLNVEQELITSFGFNKPRFDKLKEKILSVIPNLYDIKIDTTNGSPKVRYQEIDENKKPYKQDISLEDLAAGYRSILTMVGDMVVRLSNNFNNTLDDISGIVLIDEFDAHLHPKYQYELPKLLSEAFPKVQFIVTTHSPIPILGLPKKNEKTGEKINSVIFKVNRTAEEGITVDRLDDDIDVHTLSVNAVLTSDFFGFKDIYAREAKLDKIEPFDNYNEIKEMSRMEKLLELKKGFKNININRELV